ncbi:fumarylacetoacetate hydrolase family protein [Mucilaginibacter terrae]|uniref:2-dehydro-3-deoxy-D-arabinonate dehydratase n=1 Tax=Mucilaginibacter terrae TaxID=1955052 RepID=A0ABU3H162_9SPHI|nr:fumarylacetoacetate hydrolase family protein [Mucilaginibacter terrae]MDT3405456.1 2-dehydro-3-deoxy-D-arabinonate dehydratase [Mucilaginibacter terrae]
MHIYRSNDQVIVKHDNIFYTSESWTWDVFINRPALHASILNELPHAHQDKQLEQLIQQAGAPVHSQEVWASGVTYLRSREARINESKDAGGGDFYAKVYNAERPELFFKSAPYRVAGCYQPVRIRKDSQWNVPEPELTLFICSQGTIEGYTIGNDMSSRDIEGENPLYLPQAKSYDGAAALGPCLYVPESSISPDALIQLEIIRSREMIFRDEISINRMKRSHTELAGYLTREMSFPHGVYLMTGTGIVPPDSFTLKTGDVIKITIEHIGTLINTVTK